MNNETKKKKCLIAGAVAVLVLAALAYAWVSGRAISSFDECVDAGNEVMLTYPGQCRTKDGKIFVQEA